MKITVFLKRVSKLILSASLVYSAFGFGLADPVQAKVEGGDIVKEYIVNKAFDGTSDFVDITADLGLVEHLTEGSVMARFKSTASGPKAIFSASHTADDSSDLFMSLDGSTGTLTISNRENGTVNTLLNGTGSYNDGYWHVAVVTVDSSGTKLYMDGVLNAYNASTAFFSSVTSKDGMWIGKNIDSSGSQWYYNGDIERVTIYNRALTALEVQDVSNISLLTNIANESTIDTSGVSTDELLGTVGYLNNDTSPTTGSISTWGYSDPVAIDYMYTSVSIDLQSSKSVNKIELWDNNGSGRGSGTDYTLYMSDDNTSYTPISNVTFSSSTINGRLVHHFSFHGVTARYIKIHSLFSDTNYTFVLSPFQLSVKAFGLNYSSRTNLRQVAGYLNNDTSPTTGSISTWGYSDPVAIDYMYTSVGMDLQTSKIVNEVDIWDSNSSARGSETTYELYYSNDNATYTQIPAFTFTESTEAGRLVHRFSFSDVTARYIKLRSTYSDTSYTFVLSPFQSSVQAIRNHNTGWVDLPKIAGFLDHDTSPTSGVIGDWGWNTSLVVDTIDRSIGFDLGTSRRVNEIQLSDYDTSTRILGSDYTLYYSDDNITYTQIQGVSFGSRVANLRLIHTFSFNGVTARYIKVHTAFADHTYTFVLNPLQDQSKVREKAYSTWSGVSNLWDGNTATGESADLDHAEGYVEYDFGSVKTIHQARFTEDNTGNEQATHWKVQQWNGTSFIDIFPYVSSNTADVQIQTFHVSTNRIRLYVTNTNAGGRPAALEFQVMAPLPQKNMADGFTYAADSGFSSDVGYLWDGVTASTLTYLEAQTQAAEGWVEYDFGSEKTLTEAYFNQDYDGTYQATDWKVQQWDGSAAFVDIFPYVSSSTAEWQRQSLDVTTSKIRLYIKNTNVNGRAGGVEFKVMTADYSIRSSTIWNGAASQYWSDNGIVAIPNGTSIPRLLSISSLDSDNDYLTAVGYSYSDDMGVTWSPRATIPWTMQTAPDSYPGFICCSIPMYHADSGKVILFGTVVSYDGVDIVNYYPGYAYYDPSTESFSEDFYIVSEYEDLSGESGLSVPYIADNGDIYWALRILDDPPSIYHCVRIAKFTFDGTTLSYVSQSDKIYGTMWQDTDGGGDQNETALVKYDGVYYLSFRENSGFQNSISTSTDLSAWTTLEDLTWDDGTPVTGSTRTHTRWVTHSDGLYLVYTRASGSNPDNSGVFRYRAPLWIAKFDTATHRLIKSTERILMNMNGNLSIGTGFTVTHATPDATFVSTNEWGEAARALVARMSWDTPNNLTVAGTTSYILDEPFDSLTGWTKSANPAISPAGQLRIYSTNSSMQNVYRTDKSIPDVYTAKWRVRVDNYQTNETGVLRIRNGSKLLELRLENDALYVRNYTGSWVQKNVLINDYKWHEILVYVVHGQAEVFIDGETQGVFDMPGDTNADRIELWTTGGDFYSDNLKIW